MTESEKIDFIKNWLISEEYSYVMIPPESVDKIYNLLGSDLFCEPTKEIEYLYYGVYCRSEGKFYDMEKYYLAAIEMGNNDAMNNLGDYYYSAGDMENAIRYYSLAVENGNDIAVRNMGVYYQDLEDWDNMLVYYLKSIKKKDKIAIYYLKNIIRSDKLNFKHYIKMIEELDYDIYSEVFQDNQGLLLLYKTYKSKIDMIELPFKYSPDNEGFIEAKEDFVQNLINL